MSDLKSLLQEKIKENRPNLGPSSIFPLPFNFLYKFESIEMYVFIEDCPKFGLFSFIFSCNSNFRSDIENRDDNKKFSHNFTGFYKIDDEDSDSD